MILAVSALLFTVISTVVVVRLRECHLGVSEVFREFDAAAASAAEGQIVTQRTANASGPVEQEIGDVGFTDSLLALNKVGLRVPGGSPVPDSVESSSLVSVHPARSKNRDQVL